jgi:hypothetical protein
MNFIRYFRTLKMIHGGLVLGLVLFLLITTYLVYFKDVAEEDVVLHNFFMKLIPLMMIADFFIGYFMFKRKLKNIRKMSSLAQKLNQY